MGHRAGHGVWQDAVAGPRRTLLLTEGERSRRSRGLPECVHNFMLTLYDSERVLITSGSATIVPDVTRTDSIILLVIAPPTYSLLRSRPRVNDRLPHRSSYLSYSLPRSRTYCFALRCSGRVGQCFCPRWRRRLPLPRACLHVAHARAHGAALWVL